MDSNNYFQFGLYLAVLLVLSLPLGWYMARVMEGKSRVNRLFGGIERVFYRLCGISREHEMDWKQYAIAAVLCNFLGLIVVYLCLLYTSPSPRDLSTSRMPSSA